MSLLRNTPWIVFKETGELVCKRCGECSVPERRVLHRDQDRR
jgi:hypothetical protein